MTANEEFMAQAIALSHGGFPAPNPRVGCVIVRDGQVVGEGFHDHAGGPHAERVALAAAGDRAEGADVYVTLEPCNHSGRTPPCTLGLIEARVRRVVFASPDPNPVAGGGYERLTASGILVEQGVLQAEAERVNRQFLAAHRLGRPWVVLKSGITLDGRTALPSGASKWITSSASRLEAQKLRAESGCVLVGYRTVQQDDPELTARFEGVVNQPLRVVLDPDGRLAGTERVFDEKAETLHITGRPLRLKEVLGQLWARGVRGVLVEGGARTIGHFWKENLVDAVELFVAPKIFGSGPSWVEGLELPDPEAAPRLEIRSVTRVGSDVRISAIPEESLKRLIQHGVNTE